MTFGQCAVVIIIVACVILVMALGRRQRRHRQAMAALARRRRLVYTPEDRFNLPTRYETLRLMSRGYNRDCRHVLSGASAHGAIHCFELAYEVGFGRQQEVRQRSVVVLETEQELPPLCLDPDNAAATEPPEGGSGDADLARDWVAGLDRPCSVEFRHRWIVISVDEHASPERYDWLIRTAADAAERLPAAIPPAKA
jgi:hypothetical protein